MTSKPLEVHGGLARFFACRDGVENWHETTTYTLVGTDDIKLATWLMQDHEMIKTLEALHEEDK